MSWPLTMDPNFKDVIPYRYILSKCVLVQYGGLIKEDDIKFFAVDCEQTRKF